MNCQKKNHPETRTKCSKKVVRKWYCQRNSTLTRFSEEEDARLRAKVKIVLEKKIEID